MVRRRDGCARYEVYAKKRGEATRLPKETRGHVNKVGAAVCPWQASLTRIAFLRIPVPLLPFRRESPFLSRLSSSLCSTIRLFTNSLSTAAFPQVLVTQSLFHQSPFHRRLSSSPRHPVAFLPIAFPPSPFLKSSSPSRLSSSPHHPVAFPPVAFPPSPFHRRLSISCSPSTQSRPWLRKTHLAKDRLEQRRGVCDVGVGVDDELEAAGRLKEVHLVRPCGVVSQSNLPDAKRGAG